MKEIKETSNQLEELNKEEKNNLIISTLYEENPFIFEHPGVKKAGQEYADSYREYLLAKEKVNDLVEVKQSSCTNPKGDSCKKAAEALIKATNKLKDLKREVKEKEEKLNDALKSAIDDYYYIQWRNQPTLKWISDLYQMSLSVSMYFDQLTRGFGKEFTWANLNLHQFTLERGIEKLCEDKLNSLDESELVLSQSQYVAPIGNPGATIVAYRIPNYDYNEDNEGVELVNYTYYVSYYLSNNDPLLGNRKPEMHFKIVLRPGEKILKDEKLEYGENSVVSETLSEVSGRQYSEACIIINNGNNFFDSYHGGLCTRIRGVGE